MKVTIEGKSYEVPEYIGNIIDDLAYDLANCVPEPQKPEKWEPKGGRWFVGIDGCVEESVVETEECFRAYGVEFASKEEADKAALIYRRYHRLYQWIREHDPEHDPTGKGYTVILTEDNKADVFPCFTHPDLGGMTVSSLNVAHQLADGINDGTIEL